MNPSSPENVVFFLTERCNAVCEHCFTSVKERMKRKDLKVEDILKIFQSLRDETTVIITGGEPFLRKDINEVVQGMLELPKIKKLSICSNGFFSDKIEFLCETIALKYKKSVCVQISLDGLAEVHDSIRKIPGGFDRAIETCRRLKRLKEKYSNITYLVHMTGMKQNEFELEKLIEYLIAEGHNSKFSIVRGNSFSTYGVPEDILNTSYDPMGKSKVELDIPEIEGLIERVSSKFPSYLNEARKFYFQVMVDVLRTKQRQNPCYAGYKDGVIQSNGDVLICEQAVPFGNLKNWDWDFYKAWNSEEANKHRKKLSACACIHGCNIASVIDSQNKQKITVGA